MQSQHFWHFLLNMFLKKNYKFYVEKIMKIEKRLRDFLHLKRTKLKQLYVWYCTNELYIQLYGCLPFYIYIYYISYIKFNVVTLYERILTCFIIYRNAISTFLTLFVKYVFEKKITNIYIYIYIYIYHA